MAEPGGEIPVDLSSGGISSADFKPLAYFGSDHTLALQAWAASEISGVIMPNSATIPEETIYLPCRKYMQGGGFASVIQPATGGAYDDGWLFVFNSMDRANWTTQYPNMLSGGARMLCFLNPDAVAGARGMFAFGSYVFEDLRFRGYTQSIRKPDSLYCDSFEVRRVIVDMPQSDSEYQIYLGGLGDGCVVEQLHCPIITPGSTVATKGLFMRGVAGGKISHCIGGDHKLYQSHAVKIVGGHYEIGTLEVDSSSVSIDTTTFWPGIKVPLKFTSTDGERYTSSLRDASFVFAAGFAEWTGNHIELSPEHALKIDNSHARWTVGNAISNSQPQGLRIGKADGSALTDFNDISYVLSERCQIDHGYSVRRNHALNQVDTLFPGVSSAAEKSGVTWKGSSGTYYYKALVIYDNLRKIGRASTNADVFIALVLGGSGARLVLDFGLKPKVGKVRIFRGTTAGSYTSYADVDCCGAVYLYDDGVSLSGFPWVTRAAGGVDTINQSLNDSNIRWSGETCEITAGVQPSTGSWRLGDFVRKVTGAANPVDANGMYWFGYARLTQGSNHVDGTDWAKCRMSVVSPAS